MKVFLLGFMGSGKSHWGRIWADKLAMPFYDLDERIEVEQQQAIAAIFENKGEDYFREREADALRAFETIPAGIIACGGGTPCFFDNIAWMNANGLTVYLQANPRLLYDRVMLEKEKRPLLKKVNEAELLFFIEQTLKSREPFYQQAAIVLPVADADEESLGAIIQKYHQHNA